MQTQKFKTCFLMLFTMILSFLIVVQGNETLAFAAEPEQTTFSIRVPTVLPIYVDAQGTVTTSSAHITNNLGTEVYLSKVNVSVSENWNLVNAETNFAILPVDNHNFSFSLFGHDAFDTTDYFPEGPLAIPDGASIPVAYTANTSARTETSASTVANVVFTFNLEETMLFYDYTWDYSASGSGYRVSLKPAFKTALNANENYVIDGTTFWSAGAPLPSPLAEYEGMPVTSYSDLFSECNGVTTLDLSNWNTSAIINMYNMFSNCTNMTSLDVSTWDTTGVMDMRSVFNNCTQLAQLDLSSWETDSAKKMEYMFKNCTSLTELNLGDWNTSNVMNMCGMFYACSSLTSLDLSTWTTGKVISMENMFKQCSNLTTLTIPDWDTSKVTTLRFMFNDCAKITALNVSNWNTSSVKDMWFMFKGCTALTTLDVSNWNTSQVKEIRSMFDGCKNIETLDVSNWDTIHVTSMRETFKNCSSLTEIEVSGWNTEQVTSMEKMFEGCSRVTSLHISNWNTAKVTSMRSMFANCESLVSLDVSNLATGKVTDMISMFTGCAKLTSFNIAAWNIADDVLVNSMFVGCVAEVHAIQPLYEKLHGNTADFGITWILPPVFYDYTWDDTTNGYQVSLKDAFANAITNNVDYSIDGITMWQAGPVLPSPVTTYENQPVTSYASMFSMMQPTLTDLNLSKWDVRNAKNLSGMFLGSNFTSLDLSGWDISSVTNMTDLFKDCSANPIYVNQATYDAILNCESACVAMDSLVVKEVEDSLAPIDTDETIKTDT